MRAKEFLSESTEEMSWPLSAQDQASFEQTMWNDPKWEKYYLRYSWPDLDKIKTEPYLNPHTKTVTFYDVPGIFYNPNSPTKFEPWRSSVKLDLQGNVLPSESDSHFIPLSKSKAFMISYVKNVYNPENLKWTLGRYYVRFGKWRKDERSQNYLASKHAGEPVLEPGVSVYHAAYEIQENRWAIADGIDHDTITGTLESLMYGKDREIFLVTGTELRQSGSDGEPLLKNVKLVKQLALDDIYVPDIFDPRLDNAD